MLNEVIDFMINNQYESDLKSSSDEAGVYNLAMLTQIEKSDDMN